MNKKPEVTEATKKKLRDAFWELYTKKRIEQISVKEITDLAGYNRGTFYLYYKDVYDVLEQIEASVMEKLVHLIRARTNVPPENLKNSDIQQFLSSIIELYEKEKKYIMVLFSSHGDPNFISEFKKKMIEFRQNYFSKYQLPSSPYQKYFEEYCISGLLSIIAKWFENGNDLSVEEMLLLLMAISIRSGMIPECDGTKIPPDFPEEYKKILEQFHI